MTTPICDFVQKYAASSPLRLHMPGHKGASVLGIEHLDITEISGADSLFEAEGIIAESEQNAGEIFSAQTFYSTEGSSLCIRAMVHLALMHACRQGKKNIIAAGRNAHRAFVSACALTGAEPMWIYPADTSSYLSCPITPAEIDSFLSGEGASAAAVYLTSPDYLGNVLPIGEIAAVCRRHDVLLLVDNAHGAYLRFFGTHPMQLGAHMCCDSAHKTLPVLTGGAYLHLSTDAPGYLAENAKNALALYGSTSPSYMILQSLDACNLYLSQRARGEYREFVPLVRELKGALRAVGYTLCGSEELKLTLSAKPYGYRGTDIAKLLEKQNIHCEAADNDFIVFMLTPQVGSEGIDRLFGALRRIPKRAPITDPSPAIAPLDRAMSVRQAIFAPCEELPAKCCAGRVLAQPSVSCPPAVPIAICGERLTEDAVKCFEYYGTGKIWVVKE